MASPEYHIVIAGKKKRLGKNLVEGVSQASPQEAISEARSFVTLWSRFRGKVFVEQVNQPATKLTIPRVKHE
jgi:hypothetical protein